VFGNWTVHILSWIEIFRFDSREWANWHYICCAWKNHNTWHDDFSLKGLRDCLPKPSTKQSDCWWSIINFCCCDFNPTVIQNVMMEEKWLFCKVLWEICRLFRSRVRMGWLRGTSFLVFLKDFARPSLFSEGVSFLWSKANYQMVLHHMVHGETLNILHDLGHWYPFDGCFATELLNLHSGLSHWRHLKFVGWDQIESTNLPRPK